jgi:hypothetical protein
MLAIRPGTTPDAASETAAITVAVVKDVPSRTMRQRFIACAPSMQTRSVSSVRRGCSAAAPSMLLTTSSTESSRVPSNPGAATGISACTRSSGRVSPRQAMTSPAAAPRRPGIISSVTARAKAATSPSG